MCISRPSRICLPLLVFAALCPPLALASPAAGPGPWQRVGVTDGVTVDLREVPDSDLPEMRGVVTIDASIFRVLAVFDDTPRHKEWMAKANGAALVQSLGGLDRIIWTRRATPWPAQDRDAVLRVRVSVDGAARAITARFAHVTTPLKPPISGLTRMPMLDGHWLLAALGPKQTRVTYQLKVDMGGWLPDWLIRLISRRLPLRTLQGLRRQVARTGGQYGDFIRRHDPAQGGALPIRFEPPAAAGPQAPAPGRATAPASAR